VTLLSWVYFSSVIMLYGAQFTALLHREHLYETTDKTPPHADDLRVDEGMKAEG
jgi:uncharacterized BrkB/YihY/UPF0761 family membrane protein